jgi:outer membrane protein OmpA-like peptidoglycan-associated protein
MTRPLRGLMAALLVACTASPGVTQSLPSFAGVEVRTGLTFPEAATAALAVMVESDIGYIWRPQLRTVAGVSRFSANIDREPGDNEGSFIATGFWLGTRYDVTPLRIWGPYVRASLTLHRVDADAWDPAVGALLSGTNAGAAIALGGRYGIDDRGRLAGTFEVRRTFINNLAQTSFEAGLRLQRRGLRAYVPDAVAVVPLRAAPPPRPPARAPPQVAAQPPAAPVEPAAAAAPVDRAAVERVAADQAAEAERLRAEAAATRAAAAEARLRQGLERAAAVMTSVSSLRETTDAWVVTLGGGAFATGAATLSPVARSELRAMATVLSGYPGHIILVEGHTDAQGAIETNQALSRERAAAVRAALIVEGVDALWTAARGFGQDRPVADNASAAGRALNRRVEIHVSRRPCDGLPVPGPAGTLRCVAGG